MGSVFTGGDSDFVFAGDSVCRDGEDMGSLYNIWPDSLSALCTCFARYQLNVR